MLQEKLAELETKLTKIIEENQDKNEKVLKSILDAVGENQEKNEAAMSKLNEKVTQYIKSKETFLPIVPESVFQRFGVSLKVNSQEQLKKLNDFLLITDPVVDGQKPHDALVS